MLTLKDCMHRRPRLQAKARGYAAAPAPLGWKGVCYRDAGSAHFPHPHSGVRNAVNLYGPEHSGAGLKPRG